MNTKLMAIAAAMVVAVGSVSPLMAGQGKAGSSCRSSGYGNGYSQLSTYKVGSTTYVAGQYYQSGAPVVQRSGAVRSEYLRSQGYSSTPKGCQVDHIIPLSKGGADATWNMQLLPTQLHQMKTSSER